MEMTEFSSWPGLVVPDRTSDAASIRRMTLRTLSLEEHGRVRGAVRPPKVTYQELVRLVETAGLSGRGGAGFPTVRKLTSMAQYRGKVVVVANGSESEPLAHKDETLMIHQPHLVLEGVAIVADALQATAAFMVAKTKNQLVVDSVETALKERRRARLDRVPVQPRIADPGYTSGVETSVIQQLNGKGAKPAYFPVRPITRGVAKRPTFVSNVETFAAIALIARMGAEAFARMGTNEAPGTQLLTVSDPDGHYQILEVRGSTPFTEVVSFTGIDMLRVSTVLLGGYFGQLIAPGVALGLRVAPAEMKRQGMSIGAGVVAFSSACPVAEASAICSYLATQSAGQCGPCFNGLPAIAKELGRLAQGATLQRGVAEIGRLGDQIIGRGGCAMPDGAVLIARSLFRNFPNEVALHEKGQCTAVKMRPVFVAPEYAKVAS